MDSNLHPNVNSASSKRNVIALGHQLRGCRNVTTLGVRPNFSSYPPEDMARIRQADIIYFPSSFYADIFDAQDKKTFPSYHTYKFAQDKIKQTALFQLMAIPHPRTRVFYGKRQKEKILDYFRFPMIGKVARGSAMGRGVFLLKNKDDLMFYCQSNGPAYIQEFLTLDRDMRIVIIGGKVAVAYWRLAPDGDFRSNISCGGAVCFDPVPQNALDLALHTATACGWDNVGIDICYHRDRLYVIEANMRYGKEGFRQAGIDYIQMMEKMIDNGDI